MSSTSQLRRGGACHECRRRKLKCTAERPTCDNCRRAQTTCRGNSTTKQCTYDSTPEDELWRPYDAKGQLSKPSRHAPSPAKADSATAKETPATLLCWPSTPSEESHAMLSDLPTLNISGPYDNTSTVYLSDPYTGTPQDRDPFDASYIGGARYSVSTRDYNSQVLGVPSYSEFNMDLGLLNQNTFHPEFRQLLRQPYGRPLQSPVDGVDGPPSANHTYMSHGMANVPQIQYGSRPVKGSRAPQQERRYP